jgi:hypothetical protein
VKRHHACVGPIALALGVSFLITPVAAVGQPPSPPSPEPGSRIFWQDRPWFLMGANVAWYNYAHDFGGGADHGGVSSPESYSVLDAKFEQASAAGLHVLRWFTFVGSHIETDAAGVPRGVQDTVYADFDAALQLAEKYDLYYVFNLFRNPENVKSWVVDPVKRAALAQAIGPLLAHYKDNPHILSWEVFNEPDYAVRDGSVILEAAQDAIRLVARSIHANSKAYATTGTDDIANLARWLSLGADFVTLHWYEEYPEGCLLCTTAARMQADYPGSGPIVAGEWVANGSQSKVAPTDPLARWRYWYDNGYAGAWPWSLFPENTDDHLWIDLEAAATFSREHADLGPHR